MSFRNFCKTAGLLITVSILLFTFLPSEDERFTSYAEDVFRQEVQNNTLTLHYTLKSPSSYRIHDTSVSLGHVSTNSISMGASMENALATLHTYDREHLSDDNRLIYDLLEDTYTSSLHMAEYLLYEEPLSPLTGTQAQLPVLLSEFQFYTASDVDLYLRLLKTLPDYFQAIADFETEKSKQGLFMSSARAEAVAQECIDFVNMGNDHYLHKTFKNRLSALTFSKEDYQSYISQNTEILNEYVFPAYKSLSQHLQDLKKTGTNQNGISYYPQGKEYYELLVRKVTGSSRSLKELKTLSLSQINEDLTAMENALSVECFLSDSNPHSILQLLKGKMDSNFPAPPSVDITVKYVDESMEEYLSPAFYLIPAIDNSKENVIYINPAHMMDDLDPFTTLAHEGYPGHLYQTTYFTNTDPSPIRSLLSCGGYTEGWATYCEMMSYYFAPIPADQAMVMQKNASAMLGLYALADIGIHYEGWTLNDTIEFFQQYGIQDVQAIQEIFQLIIGDPANYLKYYIGYVEFLELKKDAIREWGDDFTQKRFHQEILEAGSIPFDILRRKMGL